MNAYWTRYERVYIIKAHRTGWRGAVDAFVAAITGRPRLSVPLTIKVSLRSDSPVHIAVFQIDRKD